jgi:transaldolase
MFVLLLVSCTSEYSQLLSRLFAWSVGARNIFNSVKCTLECIKVTSTTQGLKAMSKLDQLTFLEASTTAIFGVVSLRLSSSQKKSGELMVLPQSFVSSYLSNETATGLRGVQWNTSMAKTEADKKQSSKFFHQVRK